MSVKDKTCGFAFPGTWGHECGAPATLAMVFPSGFIAGRCASCAAHTGGDNAGALRTLPIDSIGIDSTGKPEDFYTLDDEEERIEDWNDGEPVEYVC